jgi:hypothetical protein
MIKKFLFLILLISTIAFSNNVQADIAQDITKAINKAQRLVYNFGSSDFLAEMIAADMLLEKLPKDQQAEFKNQILTLQTDREAIDLANRYCGCYI